MTDKIIDITDRLNSKRREAEAIKDLNDTLDKVRDSRKAKVRTYVREWRQLRGWTMDRLAMYLGVDKGSISRIERGDRQMTSDLMVRIAEALSIEVGQLFKDPTANRETYPA